MERFPNFLKEFKRKKRGNSPWFTLQEANQGKTDTL